MSRAMRETSASVALPGWGLGPTIRLSSMTAFWLGVGLMLLAVWGKGT
jgi:hypothetical protein